MNVNELWETYRTEVIPPLASPEQIKQLKMAFFAGGVALVSLIHMISRNKLDPVTSFMAIEDELKIFALSTGASDATTH